MRVEVSNNFPGRVDPVADSAEAGLRFPQNPSRLFSRGSSTATSQIKTKIGERAAPRFQSYGVPLGPPAICHEKARNDDAVRSIAGSTVE